MNTENIGLYIKKANIHDAIHIYNVLIKGQEYMKKHGNPTQWPDGFTTIEEVKQSIINDGTYVVCSGENIAATFILAIGEDKTYSYIEEGQWIADKPYATIHRIASDGTYKGIGDYIFNWCEEHAKSHDLNLRIDTHNDNKTMKHLIAKHGFDYCGIIYVSNGSQRLAYEKVLN